MTTPIFRFAPSPNGPLHLGHALSALWNQKLAEQLGGFCLLRIEDIDQLRCKPEFIEAAMVDLRWIGFRWPEPVMRQSTRFQCYREALEKLQGQRLLYPCFCTRKMLGRSDAKRPRDPDGAPLYDGRCTALSMDERVRRVADGEPHALRLNMTKAVSGIASDLTFQEGRPDQPSTTMIARPQDWGDVVIARKEFPTSYHLAVVVDDAAQHITHVVRGQDLLRATDVHVLLQHLLGLPAPRYFHHPLVLNENGEKLSKSRKSTGLAALREAGLLSSDILRPMWEKANATLSHKG